MQTAKENQPPPIEGFSAEKFRQWLAGIDSSEAEIDDADTDQLRGALAYFVGHLPLVYGHKDRLKMWERIGNAVAYATSSSDADTGEWVSAILGQLNAPHGRVASSERFQQASIPLVMAPLHHRAALMRLTKSQSFVILSMAREIWGGIKDQMESELAELDSAVEAEVEVTQ